MGRKETRNFEAEVKQILNLVVNSLYTHREIFLRELIANASDALDKMRLTSLTQPDVLGSGEELAVWIERDPDNRQITVHDNGIGMSYDEVIENLGTIAHSGAAKFAELLAAQGADQERLIGQFGVGFYSTFMVAEHVEVETRGLEADSGVRWTSAGDGAYEIEEIDRAERGTTVRLTLRDDDEIKEFLDQHRIQQIVQHHCNFINYPIRMEIERSEPLLGEDNKPTGESITKKATETLNSRQPIWRRDPKEVKRAEFDEFFKLHFHEWSDPAEVVPFRGEGTVEFRGLAFIPAKAPFDFYMKDWIKGIELYSQQVMIMKDCKDLLPEWLGFVRGVVDSPDVSLNISRETLQHNRQLRVIGRHLEKKVLEALAGMLRQDRDQYEAWFAEFGSVLKSGLATDPASKDKLLDLLVFPSSHSPEGRTTLRESVDRMPGEQKAIYYATGENRDNVEKRPQLEALRDHGFEVLFFLDRVDEFMTPILTEYDGKPLKSASRGALDLEQAEDESADPSDEQKEEKEQQRKAHEKLTDAIRHGLGDRVKEVRLSKRLKDSPVCLVSDDSGVSIQMERVLREMKQDAGLTATRILEINPDHPAIRKMEALLEGGHTDRVQQYAHLLYDQARLIEGEAPEDPVEFSRQIATLMAGTEA